MTITLYTFGPIADLPDISPFVIKAMTLLRMAGLEYVEDRTGFRRAPKGKLPFIDDNGEIVADSTLIRLHIEKTRNMDFDAHLTDVQKDIAWSVQTMCEEHLYWAIVSARWQSDANFARGPGKIFDGAPAPFRPLIKWLVRRKVIASLKAQGFGRYSCAEAIVLTSRDIESLATFIGDKQFLFGLTPCAADATVFAFLAATLSPINEWPIRDLALSKPNLVAYRDRMMQRYFPDFLS